MAERWTPNTWRSKPVKQMPFYADQAKLAAVEQRLSNYLLWQSAYAELLFLDEPTAGLDPIGASAFDELIKGLQRSLGLTVFMVTHDLDSLRAICDRIAVLIDKRILVDTMEALRLLDQPWIREYFHGPRGRAALGAEA